MQRRVEKRRKKRLLQLGVVVAVIVIVLAGAVWAFLSHNSSDADAAQDALPATVSADEAYQLYQDGAFFVDVRTLEEWDEYHIPGTTLIPLDELGIRIDEIPRDQIIVVVCGLGPRSQIGYDILVRAGFPQVTSMSGGLESWAAAGHPLE
ncbi:MAG: rhodanese-like domain-containing protein [Chloroflexi bacterium]|nr:rhodanese-like domain-containing protein [Chloroflexota bacterium]